jgi:hypothetical protein
MQDLLDVIGWDKATHENGYCNQPTAYKQYAISSQYFWDWEAKIAKPALEALGYSRVMFGDGERDSFGPLTRLVWAEKDGKRVKFIYG